MNQILRTFAQSELVTKIPYRVFLNNIEIQDLHIFRIHTAEFNIDIATEHHEKYVTTKGVSYGYWLFLKPLPPGHYTLRFASDEPNISTKNNTNIQNGPITEDFKCDIVVV